MKPTIINIVFAFILLIGLKFNKLLLKMAMSTAFKLSDDVWIKLNQSDKMYNSLASYETISSFNDIGALKTTYFLKRIGKKFNGNYKYVSLSKFRTDFNSNIK